MLHTSVWPIARPTENVHKLAQFIQFYLLTNNENIWPGLILLGGEVIDQIDLTLIN
jgi:hypothetical protein